MKTTRSLVRSCGFLLALAGAEAHSSESAWKAERAPSRPGGVESCAVRWQPYGLALVASRWADGSTTNLLTMAFAHPGATLDVRIDASARYVARASDLNYWSQPRIAEALLAGSKLDVAFHDHKGKPARVQIDLATMKSAYDACLAALAPAPSKPKANSR